MPAMLNRCSAGADEASVDRQFSHRKDFVITFTLVKFELRLKLEIVHLLIWSQSLFNACLYLGDEL